MEIETLGLYGPHVFLRLTTQVLNFLTSRFFALVPLMASLLCQLTDLSREMLTLIYFFFFLFSTFVVVTPDITRHKER